jgi:hypothetical protein
MVFNKKERLISLSFLDKPKISFLSMIKYPTDMPCTKTCFVFYLIIDSSLNLLSFLVNIHIRILVRRNLQFGYRLP